MNIRVLARVVVVDPTNQLILLVRNKDTQFWYAPGGGWEYEKENILEAASREVLEETGIQSEIIRLLYVQEFHATPDTIFFETFWLARPTSTELNKNHIDLDPNGQVEEARWFNKEELQDIKVFPKRLKKDFWDNLENYINGEDPFIGVS